MLYSVIKIYFKQFSILKNSASVFVFLMISNSIFCQETTKIFTMDDVIKLSQDQSIDAMIAKQAFEQSYVEYSAYKAAFLPSLCLNANLLNYSRSQNRVFNTADSTYNYYETNTNTSYASLQVSQNLGLTGGNILLNGDLTRNDNLDKKSKDYSSYPSISLNQPISGYNEFKWKKKIQPKKYENAKMMYIQSMENIASKAIDLFFDLCAAQISIEVSNINFQNADTLYKISQGRYEMGKISETDLLQMQLNYLNTKTSLNNAKISLTQAKSKLRLYLGFNEKINIELFVKDTVPHIEIDSSKVFVEAMKNNPDIRNLDIKVLEAIKDLSSAKSARWINGNISLSYGLSRVDDRFPDIITNKNNISNNQKITLGFQLPIVDWGLKKDQYKLAKINKDVVDLEVEQSLVDFQQTLSLKIQQFSLQEEQYKIAKLSEYVADKNYEVSKQKFIIGKIDVLELNTSQKSKDSEKLNHINAIRNYWKSLYDLRIIALYDFINNLPLFDQYSASGKLNFINQ